MGKPSLRADSSFSPAEIGSGEFRVLPDGQLIALARFATPPPSARPTPLAPPELRDVASGVFPRMSLPLDLVIPNATGVRPEGLDHRSAFLLLHVDGRSSLAEIAESVQLPRGDVYEHFVDLLDRGIVSLDTATLDRAGGR